MKRHKHISPQKNQYWLLGILAVVIVAGFLLFSGSSDKADEEQELLVDEQDQQVLEQEAEQEEETVEAIIEEIKEEKVKDAKEESKPVEKGEIGEEGLCEDYFFEQGDELKINGHEIIVDRIGKGSLRMRVDGENTVLAEGDNEWLGDGIRISIKENNILYFTADDPDNAVLLRVGCYYEDNPNDKYVEQRGKKICTQVYQECQDSFDIDLDD